MNIRTATLNDIDSIVEIYNQAMLILTKLESKIPRDTNPKAISFWVRKTIKGDVMNGLIINQSKNDEAGGTFNLFSFIPFDLKGKKIYAYMKNNQVYHTATIRPDLPIDNAAYLGEPRSLGDRLTDVDRVYIDSKFTRRKLSCEWITVRDAISDINSTMQSTVDPNYYRKMLELNQSLSYPASA